LAGGHRNQGFEVEAEFKIEAVLGALQLKLLKCREGPSPLRRDLCQCEVRTPELCTKGVHSNKYFGNFLVAETLLQHVHPIAVFPNAT
jgi:hypothetical protein